MIGASGAISGVLGAYIVLFPHGKVRALVFFGYFGQVILVPAWVMIGIWFVLQLFSGFASLGGRRTSAASRSGRMSVDSSPGPVLVWLFRDRESVARQNAVREHPQAWERLPADVARTVVA